MPVCCWEAPGTGLSRCCGCGGLLLELLQGCRRGCGARGCNQPSVRQHSSTAESIWEEFLPVNCTLTTCPHTLWSLLSTSLPHYVLPSASLELRLAGMPTAPFPLHPLSCPVWEMCWPPPPSLPGILQQPSVLKPAGAVTQTTSFEHPTGFQLGTLEIRCEHGGENTLGGFQTKVPGDESGLLMRGEQ